MKPMPETREKPLQAEKVCAATGAGAAKNNDR